MTRPRKTPIPLTIVAGPLGAGKTTLVNRLLRDRAFADTAVILNEFGRTDLENALVERAEDGIIALGGGCICCAVRGELVEALERLLRGLDNGRIAAIGRVIVESEASADPAAILAAVARHPYLSLRFRPDGIVTVLAGARELSRETVRQAAVADVVALRDMADKATLAAINPFAAIVEAAAAPPRKFVGHGGFDPATTDIDRWLGPARAGSASDGVNAFTIARERPIPLAALDRFIDFLAALQGPNLIRLRGVVATGEGDSVVVEGLGGFFWPPVIIADEGNGGARFAVVASTPLDRDGFERYLDAFLNEARIDTPDRQALTENPLAIAGFSARSGR
jgi:G3E family GTPase